MRKKYRQSKIIWQI